MPNPRSVPRLLLALVVLLAALGVGAATADAEYGEVVGSPVVLTGAVSESTLKPHVLGVDPADGSFFVGDEVTEIEGSKELHFYRIQKFSASGVGLGEARVKPKESSLDLSNVALEGVAVDLVEKRLYVLVDREREPEEEEPVFDGGLPAAAVLYAFSTEANGEHKLEPLGGKAEGALAELHPQSEEAKVALLYPHGLAVDPTNHEIVIVGQEDEQTTKGGEPELRAAIQRVHANGSLGARYVDVTNCLDEGNGAGGEAACEEEGAGRETQPFSPIVSPSGKVYVERRGEIWELPPGAEISSKRFETLPKRLLPTEADQELGLEQTFAEFPKAGESIAEEVGGTMSFVPEGAAGEGKIYLTGAVATNAAALVVGYSEPGGVGAATELGWTGGRPKRRAKNAACPRRATTPCWWRAANTKTCSCWTPTKNSGRARRPACRSSSSVPVAPAARTRRRLCPASRSKTARGKKLKSRRYRWEKRRRCRPRSVAATPRRSDGSSRI